MINREILEKIKPWLGKEKILVLKGARQVGKKMIITKNIFKIENNVYFIPAVLLPFVCLA